MEEARGQGTEISQQFVPPTGQLEKQ